MALYKAKANFVGKVSMYCGEVREITNKEVVKDLLKVGYIEKVKTPKKEDLSNGDSKEG